MLNASRINMKRNFKKITFNTICLINMLICYLLWRDICKDISCNGIECLFSNPDAIFQYCIPNFIIDYKWRHMFGCQKNLKVRLFNWIPTSGCTHKLVSNTSISLLFSLHNDLLFALITICQCLRN